MDYNDFWEMQRCFSLIKEDMERIFAPFAAANGITGGQLRILLGLRHEDGQTVSALARGMCMADANMSTQVKRLCEKGLVARRRHEDDERQVRVSLTDKGSCMAQDFVVYCDRRLQTAWSLAGEEERRAIHKGALALGQLVRRRARDHQPGTTAAEPLTQHNARVSVIKENRE